MMRVRRFLLPLGFLLWQSFFTPQILAHLLQL